MSFWQRPLFLVVSRNVIGAVVALAIVPAPLRAEDSSLPEVVRFGKHIRPIFTTHCTACHGGVKQAGDLSFVYRDKVLPPDGWIVEPGKPDESVILDRVKSTDAEEVMPPPDHGAPLSKHEVALLTKWIQQGAKWEQHWAYEPPESQPAPSVNQNTWSRQMLDRFVLARLESEGLEPSPEADPQRWLRRVSLDLTGLPPTPEERQAFLADIKMRGESAYVAVVEQLLESPHFGERWASTWLDQVRYADSKGLGLDGPRNIWKYRDWVISALDRDMPYDKFTIKQMAGDLLPDAGMEDLIATAVHRLTQSNEEGGTDDEEFRIAAIMDRVSTTWQAWQGITFGCVQCHSHPYGPFEHEEYYRFAAFFNNTADSDLDDELPVLQAPLDPAEYGQARDLDLRIAGLNRKIWEQEFALLDDPSLWQPLTDMEASSSNKTKLAVERIGDHDEFHTVGTVTKNTDITLTAPLADTNQLTAIRITISPLDVQQAVSDSEWGFVLSHLTAELDVPGEEKPHELKISRVIADEAEPFYDPQASLDAKSNRGFAAYSRIHYPRQAALLLEDAVELPADARLRVTLKHRVYLLAAFSLVSRRGHLAVSSDERFSSLVSDESIKRQREELAALKNKRKAIKSTSVPILKERPERFPRPTHVFERGLFLTKADQVTPGVPSALPALASDGPVDRLALANWLVSPENPLTARVAVNRIWAQLFGVGLVATQEDFGSSGERPSHPELLDFLALRFQQDLGWSVKKLLREIVLSRTYRQSSRVRPDLQERDPQNRLLARGPRHRLSAEVVRDQALAVSGLLNDARFGPPVHPPIPEGVWRPFAGWDKWKTPEVGDENRYRRSIYTYTKRSIPFPMFAAFDAPSREFCTPRRLRSNTPLQALMTLNDATFIECSNALAERMRTSSDLPRDQVSFGFELATCRKPRMTEVDALMELYSFETEGEQSEGLARVASVLLNLDEFLTKQ